MQIPPISPANPPAAGRARRRWTSEVRTPTPYGRSEWFGAGPSVNSKLKTVAASEQEAEPIFAFDDLTRNERQL